MYEVPKKIVTNTHMRFFFTAILSLLLINVYGQINLSQGLAAYYPFTGSANDASGNGNHAIFNNATLAPDRFGNINSAYYFNGNGSYMRVSNSPSLNPSQISIVAIVKPMGFYQGVCHGNVILNKGNNDFNQFSRYRMRFDDNLFTNQQNCSNPVVDVAHQNFYADFGGNGAVTGPYQPYIIPDQWYCLVYTFDGTKAELFVNGTLVGTNNTNNNYFSDNSDLYFGSLNNIQFPYWFNGVIDDIRIYNRPLNSAEINALCLQNNILCTGSLGDPVVNITFGAGANPGQQLSAIVPGASTTLNYVAVNGNPATPTPTDGQYTISNNVPSNPSWFSGQSDHTPNDQNGYMAFYNSQETAGLEFYKQTVTNLCGGTTYEFAAWVANCVNPQLLDGVDPNITFLIETTGGVPLGSYSTGPIPENSIFQWQKFGFFFTLPPNENVVVLKMINNNVGGSAQPGNDLAIDDITFRACGPTIGASLSNTAQLDTIHICAGTAVDLYGQYNTGYSNAAFRWQQFVSGTGWIDLPSSNSLQIQFTPPSGTGNFVQYRMVAAESANINSPNCRVSSKVLYVWVNDNPSGGITADTVCANTRGHLTFQTTSTAGPFSVLYKDPFNIGYNQINMVNGSVFPTGTIVSNPTTFTLIRVTDANGCFSNTGFVPQEATVGIKKPLFNAPAQAGVCTNKSIQLLGNNGAGYTFVWSPATYLNNPTIADPICTPAATIDYTVRITEPVCNTDSNFAVTVTAFPLPVVSIVKSNDIDCARPAAQLVANGNGSTFLWSPATGLSRTDIRNPIANPDATTKYTVTAVSDLGCESNDTLTLFVTNTGIPALSVPNAFTPNNDGKNDCFGIGKWGYAAITEFSIYNRWGQKVFTTKNVLDCWDGRLKGVLQPSGGYSYVIRIPTRCGELKRTGSVLLIR